MKKSNGLKAIEQGRRDGQLKREFHLRIREKYITAANAADWEQVLLNGGPPCFHMEEDGRFCFRAMRWAGHPADDEFISLSRMLQEFSATP